AHLLAALAADLLVELVAALVAHGLAALATDLLVERRAVALLGRLAALLAALAAGLAHGHVAGRLFDFRLRLLDALGAPDAAAHLLALTDLLFVGHRSLFPSGLFPV